MTKSQQKNLKICHLTHSKMKNLHVVIRNIVNMLAYVVILYLRCFSWTFRHKWREYNWNYLSPRNYTKFFNKTPLFNLFMTHNTAPSKQSNDLSHVYTQTEFPNFYCIRIILVVSNSIRNDWKAFQKHH